MIGLQLLFQLTIDLHIAMHKHIFGAIEILEIVTCIG